MSNGVFGSVSSSSSSSSSFSSSSARVSIPSNVRKTIQDIREITGKQHSDDEIYAVLRECSMDPNETIQKLMYLDTFHEVKRRRERRKETFNGKASEERPFVGTMRKGSRGGHGNYSSNFSSDAGGGRNGGRRENGSMSFPNRARNNVPSRAPRVLSTALPNGNGTLANGHGPKLSEVPEGQSLINSGKTGSADSELAVGVASSPTIGSLVTEEAKINGVPNQVALPVSDVKSALDSLSAPSILGQYCGGATETENGVGAQQLVAETNPVEESVDVDDVNGGLDQPEMEEVVHENIISEEKEDCPSKPLTPEIASREVKVSEIAAITTEISSLALSESNINNGQHVTFPNHFQVPEALKSGLTFGSFDVTFGPTVESINVTAVTRDVDYTSQDIVEEAESPTPCDQNESSAGVDGFIDNSQSVTQSHAELQPAMIEQPKIETQFIPDGHQNHVINLPTSYLGLVPPMLGSPILQYDGLETQAHDSHIPIYANGNAIVPPSTHPSPPLPSSIAVSPQSVPVYRQTYPPSFYPYGQYISPYYIPQMHQYMGHNGFAAPQPAAGNMYLQPQAAQPGGLKFSVPQYKPAGNAPVGSYITTQVGYPQPISSGSSMGNDELMASQLKDSQIYTAGQLQSDGTGIWVHAGTGQEMPTMQMSSVYSLPHHHHQPHLAAMFQPMTAPQTLMQQQQSQAIGGTIIEPIGQPPTGPGPTYQPNHPQQISWNTAAF